MRKIVYVILLIAGVSFLAWRMSKKTPTKSIPDEIIVGTCADFPPFESISAEGTLVGFDIDLLDALCKEIGIPCHLVNMPFDTLMPQVQMGSIHVICSGLSRTPERAARILMSRPYLPEESMVLLHTSPDWKPHTLSDLYGKKIIVNSGYNTDVLLQGHPQINSIRTPTPADALVALRYGRGEAILLGAHAARELMKKQSAGLYSTHLEVPLEPTVLGVSPHYPELLVLVDRALTRLIESGTVAELQKKWGLEA